MKKYLCDYKPFKADIPRSLNEKFMRKQEIKSAVFFLQNKGIGSCAPPPFIYKKW